MSWAAEERLNAVRARMLKAEADLADARTALGILQQELSKSEALVSQIEKFRFAEVSDLSMALADAERCEMEWVRAYWEITKILDMSELADYDDELASNVRERRALAERLLFPETNDEGISQAAD